MQIYRKVKVLKDQGRLESFSGEESKRKLVISIYFQGAPNQIDERKTEMKYTEIFQPCEQRVVEVLKDIGMNMELLSTHITNVLNSNVSQKLRSTYPVIIYTPALGLDRDMYMYNIEELAKQGFMVFTISAPHEAMFTVFPNGEYVHQSERMRQIGSDNYSELNNLVSIRKKDIQFLLDLLPILNTKDETLQGCIELDKIALIGHSLGGIAALEVAMQDERIQASVLLDPSMQIYREECVERTSKPLTLVLRQESSNLEQLKQKLGEEIATNFIQGQERMYQKLCGYGYFVKIHKASHMSFSDMPLFEEDTVLSHRTREIHGIINKTVIAFLEGCLVKQTNSFSTVMDNGEGNISIINGLGEII